MGNCDSPRGQPLFGGGVLRPNTNAAKPHVRLCECRHLPAATRKLKTRTTEDDKITDVSYEAVGRSFGNRKHGAPSRMLRRSVSAPLGSARRGRRSSRPLDSSNTRPVDHIATDHNDNLAHSRTHDDNHGASDAATDYRACGRRSDHHNYGPAGTTHLCSSAGSQQSVSEHGARSELLRRLPE